MKRIAVIPNNSKDIGLVNTKRLVEFLNGKAEMAELYCGDFEEAFLD